MKIQLKRRFMLILHDVLVHPLIGVAKAFSPSTTWGNWLHDVTIPPLPDHDEEFLSAHHNHRG